MLILLLLGVWVTTGFGGEILFCGFLAPAAAELLVGERPSWVGGLGLTSVLWGVLYLFPGATGIILTGAGVVLMGLHRLTTGRNPVPLLLTCGLIQAGLLVL